MAPFKVMISTVALTTFAATGAVAQDHHRDRNNDGHRAPQAEQARPREQTQPRQQAQPRREQAPPQRTFEQRAPQVQPRVYAPQGQPRTYAPQVQPRTYAPQVQPRTYAPQVQPRTYAPQVQPRTYAPQVQPRAYAPQVQPRTYDRRDSRPMQVQPPVDVRRDGNGGRNWNGDRAVPRTYDTPRPYRYDSRDRDEHAYYGGRTYGYTARIIRPDFDDFVPYRPYSYRPSLRIGVYYGYDGYYPYGYTPDYYFNPIPGHLYGGLRIVNAPRDAQVFADGYYVGIVDDFDGIFQHLNLEAGPHHIEINEPGLQPIAFDVNVAPGRTITFRADPYMFQ